jgi:hypothetical protein
MRKKKYNTNTSTPQLYPKALPSQELFMSSTTLHANKAASKAVAIQDPLELLARTP